ncbi:hypothetical protein HD554DRAFT_2321163 [Boletus coccyginus]|nr:hypothetical protein HD554DRAFT_2321163 [Boletus coccyginus]
MQTAPWPRSSHRLYEFNGCAWEVWGKDDELGTINLLTEGIVQRAAREEIPYYVGIGCQDSSWRTVWLNCPPLDGRKTPSISTTFMKYSPSIPIRDDSEIHISTQSGSQWDGLKHFGLKPYNVYYNNTPAESLSEGEMEIHDPTQIDHARVKLEMHSWSNHGICGGGVFLDLVQYYTANGDAPPYDPWKTHPISVAELEAYAKKQGVTFRQTDILPIRIGFVQKYHAVHNDARATLAGGKSAGKDTKRFLWHARIFAPRWPTPQGVPELHQSLSRVCKETKRYTFFFFFTIGGAASPPNAAAYF